MFDLLLTTKPDIHRVLNIFKTMVTDEDILDKEDMQILERIRQFVLSDEVSHFAAAKQLLLHIDRAVRVILPWLACY